MGRNCSVTWKAVVRRILSAVGLVEVWWLAEVLLFELLRVLDGAEAVFLPDEVVFPPECAEVLVEVELVVFDGVFWGSPDAAAV
jgi:hypothetical protein